MAVCDTGGSGCGLAVIRAVRGHHTPVSCDETKILTRGAVEVTLYEGLVTGHPLDSEGGYGCDHNNHSQKHDGDEPCGSIRGLGCRLCDAERVDERVCQID
jgi:hypothetical protein